jgi:hypothetical protein
MDMEQQVRLGTTRGVAYGARNENLSESHSPNKNIAPQPVRQKDRPSRGNRASKA